MWGTQSLGKQRRRGRGDALRRARESLGEPQEPRALKTSSAPRKARRRSVPGPWVGPFLGAGITVSPPRISAAPPLPPHRQYLVPRPLRARSRSSEHRARCCGARSGARAGRSRRTS